MTHKRSILIIVFVVGLTFYNCLLNGFVGDDNALFVKNSFYHSLQNLPKLLGKSYMFDHIKGLLAGQSDLGSGSVTYRPVDSLTYFIDRAIWGLNPFGFHLTNVLLHIFNVIFVYLILFELGLTFTVSIFAAILWGVHPIQSEAVAAIGYRADVLAATFVLLSFFCWLLYLRKAQLYLYFISLGAFFLAVFSKESAAAFPLFLLVFMAIKRQIKERLQLGFWAILAFYLCAYCFIFTPVIFDFNHELGDSFVLQALVMLKIFTVYLKAILLPWTTHSLPPMHQPPVHDIFTETLTYGGIFLSFILFAMYVRRWSTFVFLMLMWFLVLYVPVSNFKTIVNPMALRFMYLPSVGLIVAMAVLVHQAMLAIKPAILYGYIKLLIIGSLMISTFFLNTLWRDLIHLTLSWTEYDKDSWKTNMIMGRYYYDSGKPREGSRLIMNSILHDARVYDRRVDFYMGLCLLRLQQYDRAERHFYFTLESLPDFPGVYFNLGELYKIKGEYKMSLEAYWKAISYDYHDLSSYTSIFDVCAYTHDSESVNKIFDIASKYLSLRELHELRDLYGSRERKFQQIGK